MSGRFFDQTIAWILALLAAGGIMAALVGLLRVVAKQRAAAELVDVGPEGAAGGELASQANNASQASRDTLAKASPGSADHADTGDRGEDAPTRVGPKRDGTQRGVTWSYSGSTGPEAWGELDPAWRACASGKGQSPVDIVDARVDPKLKPVRFTYRRSSAVFAREGDRLVARIEPGNHVEIDGDRYGLVEMSFHTPSEHHLNGLPWEMEIQLHHRATTGELATIAFLVAPGNKVAEALTTLWSSLPREDGDEREVLGVRMQTLVPQQGNYFWYVGSETVPPCRPAVRWLVMTSSIAVSKPAIDAFVKAVGNNARPLQPLAGRAVTRSRR